MIMKKEKPDYDSPRIDIHLISTISIFCGSGNAMTQFFEDDAYEYELN